MPFSEFQGNPHCVQVLRKALARGRVPHALLFSGPDAVGKRFLARLLSMALNCQADDPADGCGSCKTCRLIALENHPDVQEVHPDGQFIKIEQIRQLIQEAVYRPFQGRCRVFIVDAAERMHPAAANAMLKILEEPPSTSKIILITPQIHALLPTIRSRCQTLRFSTLEDSEVAAVLRAKFKMAGEEVDRRARHSAGSVERAVHLDLQRNQDLELRAREFLQLAAEGVPLYKVSPLVAAVSKERGDTEDWLRLLLLELRGEVQRRSNACQAGGAEENAWRDIEDKVRAIEEMRRALEHNVNRGMALDDLFLSFSEVDRLRKARREG